MGYNTDYKGILKFREELKPSELAYLNQFLGEDIRDHKDWEMNQWSNELYYSIDLKLTDDFSGIQYDGTEKSYKMIAQINYVISQMKNVKSDFELVGKFVCQGEDLEDRYEIVIENDEAIKRDLVVKGAIVECP